MFGKLGTRVDMVIYSDLPVREWTRLPSPKRGRVSDCGQQDSQEEAEVAECPDAQQVLPTLQESRLECSTAACPPIAAIGSLHGACGPSPFPQKSICIS